MNSFEFVPQETMWSQNSMLLSLFMLCVFSVAFMSVALFYLLGVKIAELAKPAELETWIRSLAERNAASTARLTRRVASSSRD